MTEELIKAKTAMDYLMDCVRDKGLPIEARNKYYSEYLQVSKNYLIMMRG